jgi:hypothetical protein
MMMRQHAPVSADPATYRIPVADLRAFVAAVFRAT